MFPSKIVLELVAAAKHGDRYRFDDCLKLLINTAEKKGSHNVARELRALYSQPSHDLSSNDKVQSSSMDSQETDLFEIRKPVVALKDIVLSERNQKNVADILDYYKSKDLLKSNDVPVDNKIMLYGPPGSGKTMLAYVIAGELGLPVIHVNLDSLISSYLGETGKNIKQIFDYVLNFEGVLFLDEFDTIAKHRDDVNELGELKRVVTVLLQNIDRLTSDVIMIAATNHEHLLDSAIWRRFDHQLHIDYLDDVAREHVLKIYLKDYVDNVDIKSLKLLTEGLSNALMKQVIHKSVGQYVLKKRKIDLSALLAENFASAAISEINRSADKKVSKLQVKEIINVLRNSDPKTYTYEQLETVTGVPSSTIHNWFK